MKMKTWKQPKKRKPRVITHTHTTTTATTTTTTNNNNNTNLLQNFLMGQCQSSVAT
jgi:hypothetical protein